MRIYFDTAREIEMGRRRSAAPLKQITDKGIDEMQRVADFLRPLELVDVGGFYFIVAQNQTDLTGLMPRKRTTPPQPYGQGKKLKAFRCTEKTSRLLKKAAKRKISEAAYIEAALEDRFRKGGSLAW